MLEACGVCDALLWLPFDRPHAAKPAQRLQQDAAGCSLSALFQRGDLHAYSHNSLQLHIVNIMTYTQIFKKHNQSLLLLLSNSSSAVSGGKFFQIDSFHSDHLEGSGDP